MYGIKIDSERKKISVKLQLLIRMLEDKNKTVIKQQLIQNILDLAQPLRVGDCVNNIEWGDWWLNVYIELILN